MRNLAEPELGTTLEETMPNTHVANTRIRVGIKGPNEEALSSFDWESSLEELEVP